MSDENRDMESGEAGSVSPPTVGSQLKSAREAKQMSVGDIAMALKLGSKQVEALEEGHWQSLPGQTFIRGFVRNYARLLQLDAAPFMAQLDAVLESPQLRLTLPGQPKQPVAMPQTGRSSRRDYMMAWFGIALVAIAVGIYFLQPADLSELRVALDSVTSLLSKKEGAAETPAPAASATQAEPVFPPGTTPQQVMNPQAAASNEAAGSAPAQAGASPALVPPPVLEAPGQQPAEPRSKPGAAGKPTSSEAQIPAAAPAPAVAPAQAPAGGDKAATLHFSFQQDSWVQVRDNHGKVVFSQLSRAGTEQNVEGQGPFTLVIGNAPGVRISLRGKPVDLASHTQGNVARLTLE